MAQHGEKTVRRFVAPVLLDLHSDTDLTMDQIVEWLVRVARLSIDAQKHGNGPVQGSLGLCQIDWSKLKEIKADD